MKKKTHSEIQKQLRKEIGMTVICMPNCENSIKKVFYDVLEDYLDRFNLKTVKQPKKVMVNVCVVEYSDQIGDTGVTIEALEQMSKIHVQLRDPFLNGWEDNPWVMGTFVTTLCHEYIHVCQYLTGRRGFSIRGAKWDRKDDLEKYHFDPSEVEARALSDYYAQRYGSILT